MSLDTATPPDFRELPGEAQRRGNRWAFLCGYWCGKGFTYEEAARRVVDTHPKTIQGIARRAGLCAPKSSGTTFDYVARLTQYERGLLTKRAIAIGVDPEEWVRRIVACAIADDLYEAVTDGRYARPGETQPK